MMMSITLFYYLAFVIMVVLVVMTCHYDHHGVLAFTTLQLPPRGTTTAIIAMSSSRQRRGDEQYYPNDNDDFIIPPWQQQGDNDIDDMMPRGNFNNYYQPPPPTALQDGYFDQRQQKNRYRTTQPPSIIMDDDINSRFGMGTSEDFRQGSSSRTSQKRRFYDKENVVSSSRGWGNNIDNDDYTSSYAPKNINRPYYPSSQQQGSNIGDKYTDNFRDGTRKRVEQQTTPPPRWQTSSSSPLYGSNDSDMYNSEQFDYFDNNVEDELFQSSPRISWDERRRRVQQQKQQQQQNNRDNFSNFESNSIGNNRSYEQRERMYNEPMPPPPPPPRPPPMQPFDVDEDDIMGSMRGQQERFGSSDTRQPERRYEGRNEEEPDQPRFTRPMQQQQYQSPNDRGFNPREYEMEDMSEQRPRQQQPSNNRRPTARQQQYPQSGSTNQYGPGNSFEPRTGYRRGQPTTRRRRGPLQPRRQSYQQQYNNIPSPRRSNNGYNIMQDDPSLGFGYGGIRRMFDRLINPYQAFGQMNRMMERVNADMQRSMVQDQQSMKVLLSDASDFLFNDIAVRNVLGTNIELGTPFSKTSSSTMVNGVTKSRLELIIPVSGTQNTGRVRLVANQEGIMQLEVDVGGRIINVPLEKRRWDEDVIMDADVVDREVYYDD